MNSTVQEIQARKKHLAEVATKEMLQNRSRYKTLLIKRFNKDITDAEWAELAALDEENNKDVTVGSYREINIESKMNLYD